jgi:hypothetical protein
MRFAAGRRIFHLRRALLTLLLCASGVGLARAAASEINGRVTDQTRAAPAPGDDVILLRLDKGMQEEARTKTDADGNFRMAVRQPDKDYLVRVVHGGVNYDQRAAAGAVLTMEVFDSAEKVSGIHGTIEILRVGTTGPKGDVLHVSDMYEIENDSNPPLTEVGQRTFGAYLPPNATITSVMAAGPGKIGVMIFARRAKGEAGHFTVDFPLRPGANKFAFNYDVPYDRHGTFQTRREYEVQQFAVMLPKGMKFTSRSAAFAVLAAGNPKYQVEATKALRAGEGPGFELSGSGELPPLQLQAQKPEAAEQAPSRPITPEVLVAPPKAGPALTKQPAVNTQEFSLVAVTVVALLAAIIFTLWSVQAVATRNKALAIAPSPDAEHRSALFDMLRRELARLDSDRSSGIISAEDYASTRQALEKTWHRALGSTN